MMRELILIQPYCQEESKTVRLNTILGESLASCEYVSITTLAEFAAWQEEGLLLGRRIIFAISLGESGINLSYYGILKQIRLHKGCLSGSVGAVIVDGNSELFTKSVARQLVLSANMAGCTFIGRPLVEGTKSLANHTIIAKNRVTDNFGAYVAECQKLVQQLLAFQAPKHERPKLLVLHTSNPLTSNTLALWSLVREHLEGCDIQTIALENGAILDCTGCPYTTCMHFGRQGGCLYGGVMVEEVFPAILACDALVMICPNYNDAISANLSAFINRLTALIRQTNFYDKYLFGVIVSGYSGGDIVAEQLIAGLNMNKTFILPSGFAIMETANNPGSILESSGILRRAESFAKGMLGHLKAES